MVALGCKRVVVTQPRRLPCRSIYQRICDTFFQSIVGYSYAGESKNTYHPLLYTTDGLLKELLRHNPNIITKIDVLMLD
jgi:HrpA-like RNA helicase